MQIDLDVSSNIVLLDSGLAQMQRTKLAVLGHIIEQMHGAIWVHQRESGEIRTSLKVAHEQLFVARGWSL